MTKQSARFRLMMRLNAAWTALRRAPDAQNLSREALMNALEGSYDGFSVFDADDRLVAYNRRYLEIYPSIADVIRPGISFVELLRVSAQRGQYADIPVDDYDDWLQERMRRHHIPAEPFEQWLSDGRCLEILERPTIDGGRVAIRRDITHRKIIEASMQRELAFEQALLDALPFPVFYKDRDGIYLGCNDSFAEILGLPRDQVTGKTLVETHSSEKAAEFRRRDDELFEHGGIQSYETSMRWGGASGPMRRVNIVKGTFPGADGKTSGLIGSIIDLTQQKQAEEQLVQTAKLATLGQIASEVAHEINQPLSIMRMTAENCRERLKRNELAPDMLDSKLSIMIEQTARMGDMIGRLREFSRPEIVEKKPFDPKVAVNAAIRAAAPRIQADDIRFEHELPESWPQILGLPNQLTQALVNLLDNACDAVTAAQIPGERMVTLNAAIGPSGVTITVKDNGGGIPEETWPRLFTPFYTTKANAAAAGLGLSAAANMVHGLGGRIHGRNADDGALFEIALSAWEPEALNRQITPLAASSQPAAAVPRILVVDDEPLAVDCIADFLNARGFEVLPAFGPAEALDLARTHKFDAMVSDQRMPGMDGALLLKKLRAAIPGLPAIMVSGGAVPPPPAADGPTLMMAKPLILVELQQALQQLLGMAECGESGEAVAAAPTETDTTASNPVAPVLDAVSRLWLTGDITAALAHDFSQPLNVVRLNMENALDSLNADDLQPEKLRRAMESTIDQSKRMRASADRIIAVCRRPSAAPRSFSAISALRDSLAAVQDHIRMRGITLNWRPDPKIPAITGFPIRFTGAVIELLNNACDALAGAAIMHVADDPPDWVARLEVFCRPDPAGGIVIGISDNGPGLAPEIWRAAQAGRTGHGLGLSVALGVIAEMQGRAELDESFDGTKVLIRLPAAKRRLYATGKHAAMPTVMEHWIFAEHPDQAEAGLIALAEPSDWHALRSLSERLPDLPIIALCDGDNTRRAVMFGAAAILPPDASEHDVLCALDDCIAV